MLFANKSFKPFWDFTEEVLSRFNPQEQGARFSAVQHKEKPTWDGRNDLSANITKLIAASGMVAFLSGNYPTGNQLTIVLS